MWIEIIFLNLSSLKMIYEIFIRFFYTFKLRWNKTDSRKLANDGNIIRKLRILEKIRIRELSLKMNKLHSLLNVA